MTQLIQPTNPVVAQAFLECHSEGHQWRPDGVVDPSQAEPGLRAPFGTQSSIGRRSHCVNCGGDRVRWYTRSGEVVNRYRYPDGYLHRRADPDDVAPSRLDWRKRLVVTLFDDLQPAARTRKARS